jgi:hypothetical protein
MKSVRDDFLSFFATKAETLSDLSVPISSGILASAYGHSGKPMKFLKPIAEWLKKPKNRKRALLALWAFTVFVLFILTAAAIFGSPRISSSYKPGISIATFFWAFFFGIWVLFVFPAKLVTTLFGGLGGIGITELGTSAGLIAKANKSITDIATQIGLILGDPDVPTHHFISAMVWLFFGVLLITCLPAFFRDK